MSDEIQPNQATQAQDGGYESPMVEELSTTEGPAVTVAGVISPRSA